MALTDKIRFRREMRAILHRGPTLGVDLSCPPGEHEWIDDLRGGSVCTKCAAVIIPKGTDTPPWL